MHNSIVIDDLRTGYVELVDHIWTHGKETSPRGMKTREILNATVMMNDPTDALPVGVGRNPNLAIAAAEALQLIGGFADPEMMVAITKNFENFLDGGVFTGSYGPRLRTQLDSVVDRLREDPDTRQAIACIWDPLHDGVGRVPRDLPCTLVLHFVIRGGRLSLITTMRSNDVWWGVAYDFFQFTQLQLSIAHVLGLDVGPYYHHAGSLHMYERDRDAADRLRPYGSGEYSSLYRPRGITGSTVARMQDTARRVWSLHSECNMKSERWYTEQLRPYVRATRAAA